MSWTFHSEGNILHVVLNRPEMHNAFYDEMLQELRQFFLEEVPQRKERVCILEARGKSFSAGADLNWMKKMRSFTFEENLKDAQVLADLMEGLFQCPIPTIARVHGHAFGGGVGLIAACDFAIGLKRCKLGFTEAKLGLAPACIGRPVIFRIGARRARQLFLTAEVFSAQKAREIGLLDEVVETEEELDRRIQELCEQLMANSREAQKAIKSLTAKLPELSASEGMAFAAKMLAELRSHDEAKEGIDAFLEKRSPRWSE